jgi:hypothetical protein
MSHVLEVGKVPHFQPEPEGKRSAAHRHGAKQLDLSRGALRMIARSAQRHR